jgi:hypothetical protein
MCTVGVQFIALYTEVLWRFVLLKESTTESDELYELAAYIQVLVQIEYVQ